jgi:hypothetical protein
LILPAGKYKHLSPITVINNATSQKSSNILYIISARQAKMLKEDLGPFYDEGTTYNVDYGLKFKLDQPIKQKIFVRPKLDANANLEQVGPAGFFI